MVSAVPQRQYGPAYDILIVDNKELTRDMVQKILQQEGYTVDTARHGKEAIEKLRASQYGYRLIITEMIMPYAGGFEVIKTTKRESRIPVLVLSAIADEATISEAFRLSADDFLKKPFMASELVQRIQRLLVRYSVPVYPGKTTVDVQPVQSIQPRPTDAAIQKRVDQIKEGDAPVVPAIKVRKVQVPEKASSASSRAKKSAAPAKPAADPAASRKSQAVSRATASAREKAVKPVVAGKARAKTATGKEAAATSKSAARSKKEAEPVKKKASEKKAAPVKKNVPAPAKKAAPASKKAAPVKGRKASEIRSKIIIKNSIPMIRPVTPLSASFTGGMAEKISVNKTAPWFCAMAV